MARKVAYSVLGRNRPLTNLELINNDETDERAIGDTLNGSQLTEENQRRIREQTVLLSAHAAKHTLNH